MAKEKSHHWLPIRLIGAPSNPVQICIGPTTQGDTINLVLPQGNAQVRLLKDSHGRPAIAFLLHHTNHTSWHVFKEVETKDAAIEHILASGGPHPGSPANTNTADVAQEAWDNADKPTAEWAAE